MKSSVSQAEVIKLPEVAVRSKYPVPVP